MKPTSIARLIRQAGAGPSGISRRRFLQAALAAGAALMLPQRQLPVAQAGSRPRVLVIGAGFGGLSCAYQLQRVGADVQVIEARNRVGGRVFTLNNFVQGKVVEAGAELIGGNHPTWMAYAKEFGLALRDVSDNEEYVSPILINGNRITDKQAVELVEQIDKALALMNADAQRVDLQRPWLTPGAAQLDRTSLAQVAQAWPVAPEVRAATLALLSNDNVLDPDQASYLALLINIAGGGIEGYWTESEIYRCDSGNQALAFKLAQVLGDQRIQLRTPVKRIQLLSDGVRITTAQGQRLEADVVVLTAPPTTWDRLGIEPTPPSGLIPYAGPAIKHLSQVEQPFWLDAKLGPNALTDTPVGEFWDATDGQRRRATDSACLTVFSGGKAANRCLDVPRGQRDEQMTRWIEDVYPGYGRWARRRLFMGWPEDQWTRCGYTSPTLGQVTSVYPKLDAGIKDRLFFAGEYTSLKFTGFMEGGLHSGAELANKLAKSLNLA